MILIENSHHIFFTPTLWNRHAAMCSSFFPLSILLCSICSVIPTESLYADAEIKKSFITLVLVKLILVCTSLLVYIWCLSILFFLFRFLSINKTRKKQLKNKLSFWFDNQNIKSWWPLLFEKIFFIFLNSVQSFWGLPFLSIQRTFEHRKIIIFL